MSFLDGYDRVSLDGISLALTAVLSESTGVEASVSVEKRPEFRALEMRCRMLLAGRENRVSIEYPATNWDALKEAAYRLLAKRLLWLSRWLRKRWPVKTTSATIYASRFLNQFRMPRGHMYVDFAEYSGPSLLLAKPEDPC